MDSLDASDELHEVHCRRFGEAVAAGLSVAEAALFADSNQDIGLLRSLVEHGCPHDLIAAILI